MFASEQVTLSDGRLLTLREAVPADAAELLEFAHRVSAETDNLSFGAGEFDMTLAQETAMLKQWQEDPGCVYILALLGGAIVGSMTFSSRTGRPRLQHVGGFGMVVRQDHWGLGIGRRLLSALIGWARTHGRIMKVNLEVRVDNPRAIALYERSGFVHEGTRSRAFRVRGEYVSLHQMGLEL